MRNYSIDLARIVAAYGVTLIHLAPSTALAERVTGMFSLFAVPFFLLTSLFLLGQKLVVRGGEASGRPVVVRVLVPFLAWTLVYLALLSTKGLVEGNGYQISWIGALLYGGSSVHLYFLPLLAAYQLLVIGGVQVIRGFAGQKTELKPLLAGAGLLVVAAAWGSFGAWRGAMGFGHFWQTGALYLGISGVLLLARRSAWQAFISGGVLALLLLGFWVASHLLPPVWVLSPLLAGSMLWLCLAAPLEQLPKPVGWLGLATFGIYLSHVVFLEAIELGLGSAGLSLTPYSLLEIGILGVVIFGLGAVAVVVLRLNDSTRLLFLGETSRPTMTPTAQEA